MANRGFFWTKAAPYLRSIARIVTGLLFMQHGAQKWLGFPGHEHLTIIPWDRLFTVVPGLAGLLELVGGGLIVLGLCTRPVAFILAGEMAFAYFLAHAPGGFWPVLNGGGMAIMFCFVYLYLSAAGAGPWSLDRLRGRA